MSISSEERKRVILEELRSEGQVRVLELSEQFSVSEETIRRDLILLENEGIVKRVYGGAIRAVTDMYEPPYLQRQNVKRTEKEIIGRKAAELIESGDTIVIDVGTTALELAKSITNRERLTVLTNSIAVAYHLMEAINAQRFSGNVIVIGGDLNPEQQSLTGSLSEEVLSKFRVNKAFVSIGGISPQRGISDYDVKEASMSRLMIRTAAHTIVLADDSKINREVFVEIAPLNWVHTVVSNVPQPDEWKSFHNTKGLQWIEANGKGDL
ncbi:DeoR/GlpR family DNA-binding transcription regulator [Paenibacillus peoriae]|uniref:DeoR/GlpR family DNA-binding transcription regulator n=1 Tax=Paenibacillus peoriae TaxID=59893 RepID=UPI00026C5B6F|nr:DeoR/GlpR family DNA-binding transcription regulator [Paenibacillus peoriae]MEC0183188.1 DeoR/GlpR family DNA-binding transcription regulator [Paenibacillus peoriae]